MGITKIAGFRVGVMEGTHGDDGRRMGEAIRQSCNEVGEQHEIREDDAVTGWKATCSRRARGCGRMKSCTQLQAVWVEVCRQRGWNEEL